jgi:hypothetical protein
VSEAKHTPGTRKPTPHQMNWLLAISTGKVMFDLNKHALLGYPGNPRRANCVMTNALRAAGWVTIDSPGDRFSRYPVSLTATGRAAIAKAAGSAS